MYTISSLMTGLLKTKHSRTYSRFTWREGEEGGRGGERLREEEGRGGERLREEEGRGGWKEKTSEHNCESTDMGEGYVGEIKTSYNIC